MVRARFRHFWVWVVLTLLTVTTHPAYAMEPSASTHSQVRSPVQSCAPRAGWGRLGVFAMAACLATTLAGPAGAESPAQAQAEAQALAHSVPVLPSALVPSTANMTCAFDPYHWLSEPAPKRDHELVHRSDPAPAHPAPGVDLAAYEANLSKLGVVIYGSSLVDVAFDLQDAPEMWKVLFSRLPVQDVMTRGRKHRYAGTHLHDISRSIHSKALVKALVDQYGAKALQNYYDDLGRSPGRVARLYGASDIADLLGNDQFIWNEGPRKIGGGGLVIAALAGMGAVPILAVKYVIDQIRDYRRVLKTPGILKARIKARNPKLDLKKDPQGEIMETQFTNYLQELVLALENLNTTLTREQFNKVRAAIKKETELDLKAMIKQDPTKGERLRALLEWYGIK